jgi:hypothetical protein
MHNRFINNYDGPYATVLQFNRTVVERFIMLTGFGGTITLASLPHRAYLERRLEGEENPYYKVNATADGWAVQINGQKILEGIQKKPSKKISDDVRFAREFNFSFRHALADCVRGETMSGAKDELFRPKLFYTLLGVGSIAVGQAIFGNSPTDYIINTLLELPMEFALINFGLRRVLKIPAGVRLREGGLEGFLPPVKIEKYAVGRGYLGFKGRTLVAAQDLSNK